MPIININCYQIARVFATTISFHPYLILLARLGAYREESHKELHTDRLQPCLPILDQGESEKTLAYHDTAAITAVKSFTVQAPIL